MQFGTAIAQTSDGYLWLSTSSGLVRFDGVKFAPFSAPGIELPARGYTSLLGARDGSLWIGTTGGLLRLKDGHLQRYSDPNDHAGITVILEAHDGSIWVTRYHLPPGGGPLCQVQAAGLHCYGKSDGIPVTYGLGLAQDSDGSFWFGSSVLCHWNGRAATTFFDDVLRPGSVGHGVVDVAAADSGSAWATIDGVGPNFGVRQFTHGKWGPLVVPGFNGTQVRSHALFIDRDQSLWVGTENDGLYRIHGGVADHYGSADGLSGNSVVLFYQDREGDLWVLTDGGLDMFRNTPVVTYSTNDVLSSSTLNGVLALHDGSIWVGGEGALNILRADGHTAVTPQRGLPGQDVRTVFQDRNGAIWLGIDDKLVVYRDGRFEEVKRPDGHRLAEGKEVTAIAEDSDNTIWALTRSKPALFTIRGRAVEEETRANGLVNPSSIMADPSGGLWLASKNAITHYQAGRLQTIPLTREGDPLNVLSLFVDSDNSVLASTVQGLYRWDGRALTLLNHRNGLPCDGVTSVLRDNDGALWLYMQCAIVKIDAAEVAKWQEHPDSLVANTAFDGFDGAHPLLPAFLNPAASKAPDGKLWFSNGVAVQAIDPHRLYENRIPPPVYIEDVVADHTRYPDEHPLRLPALTRDLQIDYTALSFAIPQRVRFRYRLEGYDAGWQEAGSRRQAFYTNLGPGNYRFHVIACNSSGIWNDAGAELDFKVAPAWYQNAWVRLFFVFAAGLLIWMIYRLRVRQVAHAIRVRYDERLAERTRIARDLHDTLLQTIQGSKMVAEDALERPGDADRMRRALVQLSSWLERATEEGRAALNALRISTIVKNDLAEAFKRALNEQTSTSMAGTVSVIGNSREMHPIVRDEVYRIGYEAIRNAYAHSGGNRLEVELRYGPDFSVRIHDNGAGIDPPISIHGKDNHFGLEGMRERAVRIRGKLTIVSSAEFGTEVMLVLPGSITYTNHGQDRLRKFHEWFRRALRTTTLD